jgi:hypothetical protein
MTKKNPTLNIKAIKRSHIRRYGKPLKGTSRLVTVTPDMIVHEDLERGYWMSWKTYQETKDKIGGTI